MNQRNKKRCEGKRLEELSPLFNPPVDETLPPSSAQRRLTDATSMIRHFILPPSPLPAFSLMCLSGPEGALKI